ncbi:carbohydrate esterase family 4 protein [Mycena sp. CBHHK59/15]|nr:carbohydrate esterase family 4 protein [Mycena sp. CBHHK59/15]
MFVQTSLVLLTASLVSARAVVERASAPTATVYSRCTVPNTVALTFDDGPYKYMKDISDVLTANNAKGTFFVNGYNYDCIYDKDVVARLQYTYTQGHQICSHTWSHPHLTELNSTQITNELVELDTALYKILGIQPYFLRPPYGEYDDLVRQMAYQQNKGLVLWDFDSGDSIGATLQESEAAYDNVTASHPPNLLALNHETEKTTAKNLTLYAITELKNAGYNLVTVAECLGLQPYSIVGALGTSDSTWFCPEDQHD